jgi:uncharacterized membrane protein YfhO
MKHFKKYWPLLFFVLISFVYYWKVFLKGYVAFPGDLMVGAYLPWLENKWGYPAGVYIKNPLISDIFSQFYMWKSLIGEGWSNLSIPLWNPYSYSGYPLLANFHSGVFYPLNLLYVFIGDIWGWNLTVIFPSVASALTMYWFLRVIKLNKIGSIIGSVIYAYSGFAISWAQFVTADQAMIWMPLLFISLEKFFETKRSYFLYWLPIIFFLLITSGHFQIMVYIIILTGFYFFWKWSENKDFSLLPKTIIPAVLSIGLVCFQLLPTIELMKLGLRSVENYISAYNYGLLPLKYLVTLIAPDYFGNPATGNFFGAFNYHEAIFYTGVFSVFTLVTSMFLFLQNKYVRFFSITAIISFMFGFDTILGKAVYLYNVPGVSTSSAGRVAVIFSMSLAILAAITISNLNRINYSKLLFSVGIMFIFYAVIFYLAKYDNYILTSENASNMLLAQKRAVTIRNLILPGGLVLAYSILILLSKRWSFFVWGIVLLTCLEMFRFGWKYIPFVPQRIVYPDTPVITFIKEKSKQEIFRVDRERAEVMPPATWMQYRFMSPSGYDPMAIKEYVDIYQRKINGNISGQVSRYSELERYDSEALGEFNVKYILAVKRDKEGKLGGFNINYNIDQKVWNKVYESEATAVLENTNYKERARYTKPSTGIIKIDSYTPNKVTLNYSGGKDNTLLLADTFYPGWIAYVNKVEVPIVKCDGIFRCVPLKEDAGEVIFSYEPASFYNGLKISVFSLIAVIFGLLYFKNKK